MLCAETRTCRKAWRKLLSTVQDIINRFKISKPEASTTYCLTLFNDAAKRLGISMEIRQTMLAIDVVAGQQEYVLPPSVMTIQEVYYLNSNSQGDAIVLTARNVDNLAEFRTGWRAYLDNNGPWEFYRATTAADNSTNPSTANSAAPGSAMVLGLVQLPNLSTTNGFPILNVYCSTWVPFAITDSVYDHLGGDDVWVDRLEVLYAKGHLPNEYEFRKQVAADSLADNMARVHGTTLQDEQRFQVGWIQRRRRV